MHPGSEHGGDLFRNQTTQRASGTMGSGRAGVAGWHSVLLRRISGTAPLKSAFAL